MARLEGLHKARSIVRRDEGARRRTILGGSLTRGRYELVDTRGSLPRATISHMIRLSSVSLGYPRLRSVLFDVTSRVRALHSPPDNGTTNGTLSFRIYFLLPYALHDLRYSLPQFTIPPLLSPYVRTHVRVNRY